MTGSFEHYCQRSEDREAEARNLALFSHLSGENRARMGWPQWRRILAFQLSGDDVTAQRLADEMAFRLREKCPDRPMPAIPHQRRPHPLDQLEARRAARADRSDIPYRGA